MQQLITDYSLGAVATVDQDGSPAVSPKGTFIIVDESTIAFGDIRSPKTVANLQAHPDVEVLFTDVLARRALRVKGRAEVVPTDHELSGLFAQKWADYWSRMKHFVAITVERAELVTSPAYDVGFTAEELRATYLEQFTALAE